MLFLNMDKWLPQDHPHTGALHTLLTVLKPLLQAPSSLVFAGLFQLSVPSHWFMCPLYQSCSPPTGPDFLYLTMFPRFLFLNLLIFSNIFLHWGRSHNIKHWKHFQVYHLEAVLWPSSLRNSRTFASLQKEPPCSLAGTLHFLPSPGPGNHKSALCLYRFVYSGHVI